MHCLPCDCFGRQQTGITAVAMGRTYNSFVRLLIFAMRNDGSSSAGFRLRLLTSPLRSYLDRTGQAIACGVPAAKVHPGR